VTSESRSPVFPSGSVCRSICPQRTSPLRSKGRRSTSVQCQCRWQWPSAATCRLEHLNTATNQHLSGHNWRHCCWTALITSYRLLDSYDAGTAHLCFTNIHSNNNITTTILRPFVWDYPGEPVPEETFTHLPSWSSSSNLYQLLPSTTINSILPIHNNIYNNLITFCVES